MPQLRSDTHRYVTWRRGPVIIVSAGSSQPAQQWIDFCVNYWAPTPIMSR
jgi:hypothetical protein